MKTGEPDREAASRLLAQLSGRTGLFFSGSRLEKAHERTLVAMASLRLAADSAAERLLAVPQLFDQLVAELTVGETYFFREAQQFEAIRKHILPTLKGNRAANAVLRAWSAGCASGEEPYSLAILAEEEGLAQRLAILATDISPRALAGARVGSYEPWSLRNTEPALRDRYFSRQGNRYAIAERFRHRVRFAQHNLAAAARPPTMDDTAGQDLILCRNVLIYFDRDTIKAVARRLFDSLTDDGCLITASTDPPLQGLAPFNVVQTAGCVFYNRRRTIRSASMVMSRPLAPTPVPTARADEWTASSPTSLSRERVARLSADRRKGVRGERFLTPASREPAADSPAACAERVRRLADGADEVGALDALQPALRAHPTSIELRHLHVLVLMALGRYEKARTAVQRLIYLDPTLAAAHFLNGSVLRHCGMPDAARRAFERACALCSPRPAGEPVPLFEGATAVQLAELARRQIEQLSRQFDGGPA